MVSRAGRIVDVFIPIDKRSNSKRGFAFIRFQTLREAEKAIELVDGSFWGGRKIQANIATQCHSRHERKDMEKRAMPTSLWPEEEPPPMCFPEGKSKRRIGQKRKAKLISNWMDSGRGH
jgi:RNA recognition motif-containing protein